MRKTIMLIRVYRRLSAAEYAFFLNLLARSFDDYFLRPTRGVQDRSQPCHARESGRPNPVSCLSVMLRRRQSLARTAIGSAALAVATLLAIQGCAPGSSADAGAGSSHGPAYAQTPTQAQGIFTRIVQASAAAAASGDTIAGLAVTADAQWAQAKGQYAALAKAGTPVPVYKYGTPAYYIPAPGAYPLWFVVNVLRTPEVGGRLGPAVNTIMLFEKGKPVRGTFT